LLPDIEKIIVSSEDPEASPVCPNNTDEDGLKDIIRGNTKYLDRNQSHCYFVHHKFHRHFLGIEHKLPWKKAGALPPGSWHGFKD
jgi:hypothetical protein